ncbi:MAG: BatD family protein [Leptospiraceae bacterium]|nr:BatD family protein [Leptospiraceae bacterium]
MKTSGRIAFVIVGLAVLCTVSCSPDSAASPEKTEKVTIKASVSATACRPGEPVLVTIRIQSSDARLRSGPDLDQGLPGFQVVGRSDSTSIQILNGSEAETRELGLTLLARTSGDWKIGPFKVVSESGKVYTSNTLAIRVDPDGPGARNAKAAEDAPTLIQPDRPAVYDQTDI